MPLHNSDKPLVLILMLHGCNTYRSDSHKASMVFVEQVLIEYLGCSNFISKPATDSYGFPIFFFLCFVDKQFPQDFFINKWYNLTEKQGLKVATSYEKYYTSHQLFINE